MIVQTMLTDLNSSQLNWTGSTVQFISFLMRWDKMSSVSTP